MRKYLTAQARMDALPASFYNTIQEGFLQKPKEPLKAGLIFFMDTNYKGYEKTITFETYTAAGEAAIIAAGSKDIPILNDYVTDITYKVVDVKMGLIITALEQEAIADGASQFSNSRTAEIMYQVNRKIDKLIFEGSTPYKVPGLLGTTGTKTHTFTKEISTCSGYDLLEELRALKNKTEEDETGWSANVLVIPPEYKPYFTKGMDPVNPKTVMQQINEEGLFDLVISVSYLKTTDTMWALDADKMNMEVAMVRTPRQLNTFVDEAENIQINYGGRTAGLKIYHKEAITKVSQP